jgi:hypothetical protein
VGAQLQAARHERKSKSNDAAASNPTTDGTNVYALFSDFGLAAYSLTGGERWRRPLGPFNPPDGMASSPVLAGGLSSCSQIRSRIHTSPHIP